MSDAMTMRRGGAGICICPEETRNDVRIVYLSKATVFGFLFVFLAVFALPIALRAQPPKASEVDADKAVETALRNNQELDAMRRERDAARAMIAQARLRANPSVEAKRVQDVKGADSQTMAEVMLPLETGGRRTARIRVAEAELAVRERSVENAERLMAADVRMKFGEAVAAKRKAAVAERIVADFTENYRIISARVTEGKTAPLEQNMMLVELNRMRSGLETATARAETALLELRNMLGMKPDGEPLVLADDLGDLLAALPKLDEATAAALLARPDLGGARALVAVADARIESAKAMARPDVDLTGGYQRMVSGFPLKGLDDAGMPMPIMNTTNMFTFGVRVMLPVRNRNQGEIEAATFEREAARSRIVFGEITVRREVATAFAKYERAVRAQSIFENGVRDQAAANLRVYWQMYELGRNSLADYVTQHRSFLDIENETIDAQLETYNSRIEILRAANAADLIKR